MGRWLRRSSLCFFQHQRELGQIASRSAFLVWSCVHMHEAWMVSHTCDWASRRWKTGGCTWTGRQRLTGNREDRYIWWTEKKQSVQVAKLQPTLLMNEMVRSRFQAERERENPPYVTGHPEDRNTALDERQDWIQNKSEAFDVLRTGRSFGCCWSFIRHSARGVHLHAVCLCSCSSLTETWRQVDMSTGAKRMSWACNCNPAVCWLTTCMQQT